MTHAMTDAKRKISQAGRLAMTDDRSASWTIKQAIVRRTGGRIQMLEVEVVGERVIVRGRARTYYLKQLALQGVFDVLGSAGSIQIELNVEVVSPQNSNEKAGTHREATREATTSDWAVERARCSGIPSHCK